MLSLMVRVPEHTQRDLAAALVRARLAAGLKHETLAALMGITPTQLSQQLAGQGHLSIARLLMATEDPDGRVFWQHFLPALADLAGVEQADAVAALLDKAVSLIERRMLKASVGNAVAERRIA